MRKRYLPVKGCEECEEFKTICVECLESAIGPAILILSAAVMTKEDIVRHIKEAVK